MVNKEFNLFDKTCKGYDPLEAAKAAYQIMFYPKKGISITAPSEI